LVGDSETVLVVRLQESNAVVQVSDSAPMGREHQNDVIVSTEFFECLKVNEKIIRVGCNWIQKDVAAQ
jgi:hypothetical protein